jgi:urease accessory protein
LATIVHVAPEAGKGLDDLRAIMEASGVAGGASAFDGLLTIRLAAADGLALRQAVTRLIGCFWGDPPRVWMT